MKNLYVFDKSKKINKFKIHKLISLISKELSFNISYLEINFINFEEIHRLNKSHLKHDYSTDIITFDYTSNNSNSLDAEIFISIDDAEINAKKYKVSLNEELFRLVIHGILHLLNYDDKKVNEKKVMKLMENKLLYMFKFVLL